MRIGLLTNPAQETERKQVPLLEMRTNSNCWYIPDSVRGKNTSLIIWPIFPLILCVSRCHTWSLGHPQAEPFIIAKVNWQRPPTKDNGSHHEDCGFVCGRCCCRTRRYAVCISLLGQRVEYVTSVLLFHTILTSVLLRLNYRVARQESGNFSVSLWLSILDALPLELNQNIVP